MRRACVGLTVLAAALAGCGDSSEDPPNPGTERADRPAKAPRGWRTLRNAPSGFTVAVPRGWTVRRRGASSVIQSADRLLALTLAADRSPDGRTRTPADYARETLRALPGFESARIRSGGRVRGSPYRSARAEARGRPKHGVTRQRVTVAAFSVPDQVTYSGVAYRNAEVRPRANDRELNLLLSTLRARPPRF